MGGKGVGEYAVLVAEHDASGTVAIWVLKCILKPKAIEVPVGHAAEALAVVPVWVTCLRPGGTCSRLPHASHCTLRPMPFG